MKILFVDDEETIRELFLEYFKDEFEIELAADGLEAYTIARLKKFDLIISDISLPKLNGIQFIQKLRADNDPTAFLVITGDSDIQLAIDVFRMGAVDFFLKPFRMDALRRRIKRYENADVDLVSLAQSGELKQFYAEFRYSIRPVIRKINAYVALISKQISSSPLSSIEDLVSIKIVLYELLANAIEHGVAGVSYKEKQAYLETNDDYFTLVDQKCRLNQNCIHLTVALDEFGVTVVIRDDGNGFDLTSIPDPLENPSANLVSGRGIFLAKMNIDTIVYNKEGNEVRFYKTWSRLSSPSSKN